ncbi:hypothetical protein [Thalassolituus sp.]|uniref:hypothetical protein n=1 Tax=Thalassolituus sp. TaxID=2030822 RepID=UPI0035173A19
MKKLSLITASAIMLSGCFGNSDSSSENNDSPIVTSPAEETGYLVAALLSDYVTSQVSIGTTDQREFVDGYIVKSESDYTLDTYGTYLYHIGRNNIDTLERYDALTSFLTQDYSYSLAEDGSDVSTNAYQLLQVSETKAYLISYGKPSILIIDPSASNESDLVTGEIDLSAYSPEGTTSPTMVKAVIADNKLFVAMQRLNADWSTNTAYLAVIDTTSDTEINTGDNETFNGIELSATNPGDVETDGTYVFVIGRGDFATDSGGLDRISTDDYSVEALGDDTTFADLNDDGIVFHYDEIELMGSSAFMTVSIEGGSWPYPANIYSFDPSAETPQFTVHQPEALQNTAISLIRATPDETELWVATDDSSDPQIYVLDETGALTGDAISFDQVVRDLDFIDVTE